MSEDYFFDNSGSYLENYDTTDTFYNTADTDWDISWDSSITPMSEESWWSYITDLANTKVGSGIIQGAAAGAGSIYASNIAADAQEESSDKNLAFQREKLLADQQIAAGQLALGQAVLADKITTRARHNASIGQKSGAAKKFSFGG